MSDGSARDAIGVDLDGHVAIVELRRPPHNFLDTAVVRELADRVGALDRDDGCRVILLASQGSAFCAGGDFSRGEHAPVVPRSGERDPLHDAAARLFDCGKPMVAAVHGAAVGGGLGLAMAADFRVTCPQARFAAVFNRLGVHPGFGLSVTLPRAIGAQRAELLFYTGRRVGGEEAVAIGMADLLVPQQQVRAAALELAREIACSAPLAVRSTRATMRAGLAERVRSAMAHEVSEQAWQYRTEDFREGVAAMAARRPPAFKGR